MSLLIYKLDRLISMTLGSSEVRWRVHEGISDVRIIFSVNDMKHEKIITWSLTVGPEEHSSTVVHSTR